MHGLAKIMGGVSGIGGMLQRVGLPDELARALTSAKCWPRSS